MQLIMGIGMLRYKYEGIFGLDVVTLDTYLDGSSLQQFDYNASTGVLKIVANIGSEQEMQIELYMIANFGENYSVKEEV